MQTNFEGQLSFDDEIVILEEQNSEMYSKLNSAKNNNYKMPKNLYNEIMSSDMHPNVYCILLSGARSFNLTFDRCYKNDCDVVRVDTIEVYKKILYSKSSFYIGTALTTLKLEAYDCWVEKYKMEANYVYDVCASLTIDFLKKCNDNLFTSSFINFSEINWNNFFEFLSNFIESCKIDDKFLWEKIVKCNLLNKENMSILLKDKIILMIMYLINCKIKFKSKDKKRIREFLNLKKVQDNIKEIDLYFYENKIKKLLIEDNNKLNKDEENQTKLSDFCTPGLKNNIENVNIDELEKERLSILNLKNIINEYINSDVEEYVQTSLFVDEKDNIKSQKFKGSLKKI